VPTRDVATRLRVTTEMKQRHQKTQQNVAQR
jgi:hypothetical protein